MLLKNLMEDNQLNFNQPLLSVRRFTAVPSEKDDKRKTDPQLAKIPPLPSYKSELKSGPVRNPGTIPFVWEQSPGRPKNEGKSRNHVRPPIAPKLPPGRILQTKKQDSDKNSEDPSVSQRRREVTYGLQSVLIAEENVETFESPKEAMKEDGSDSGEGDETYLDALDTLSRTESFFLNCSVSGISGVEGPNVNTSGSFMTDPKARDFMMDRFLPAAKAMTSETTQYAPRKQQSVVQEHPRQIVKVVNGDNRPQLRYGPNVVPNYAQYNGEEESDDDYDDPGQFPSKVCGLLPRFCSKSSFCLLNPVPGMSVRTRVPMSPGSRTHVSSSSGVSCSENENEPARGTVYEQRSMGGLQTKEANEDESFLNNHSKQNTCHSNSQKLEGSALYRRLQGSSISPGNNDLPQSPYSEQKENLSIHGEEKNAGMTGFSLHKKCPRTFQDLLSDPSSYGEVDSGSPAIEKTLYVDIVHKVETPNINSNISDTKGLPNSKENDLKNLEHVKEMDVIHSSVDSSFKDTENFYIENEEANSQAIAGKAVDFSKLSSSDKSNQVSGTHTAKDFGHHEDVYHDSTGLSKLKVPNKMSLELDFQQPSKTETSENFSGKYSEFPIPPPLPKSPSDSWLWRTLPSMSSRNTGIKSRIHAAKTLSVDAKWGANVKTTKGQHQNLRFSEELLVPIPET